MRRVLQLAAGVCALFAVNAVADVDTQEFIPESGFYWNLDEPGRGYAIEVQDRTLFMTFYVYTEQANAANRRPIWYTASGTLVRQPAGGTRIQYRLNGDLFISEGGQCLGCDFVSPDTTDTGRNVIITFDGPAHAIMNVGGEEIELVRFWYSPSINDPILALLGQWMIVTDFTSVDDTIQPFEGDLLELGFTVTSQGSRTAEGFRGGTNVAVAGAYDSQADSYVIVVGERSNEFLAYYFPASQFGTDRFIGLAERYTPGRNLTGLGFPMQGYRISDRTFAENQLNEKSAATAMAKAPTGRPRHAQGAKSAMDIDVTRLNQVVRELEKQIALPE